MGFVTRPEQARIRRLAIAGDRDALRCVAAWDRWLRASYGSAARRHERRVFERLAARVLERAA